MVPAKEGREYGHSGSSKRAALHWRRADPRRLILLTQCNRRQSRTVAGIIDRRWHGHSPVRAGLQSIQIRNSRPVVAGNQ